MDLTRNETLTGMLNQKSQATSDAVAVESSLDLGERSRQDEVTFRRRYPVVWWVTLLGPFVLTIWTLVVIWEAAGWNMVVRLLTTAAATFFFFGKFVILGGSDGQLAETHAFFTTEQLFTMVLFMDTMTACLLTFHMGFLFRIPFLGERLRALVDDGHFILKTNPWMKRVTFIGVIAFVMFPLAATGSIGGSIFGRLLGMSRLGTFLAICIGNLLGCMLMYFGSNLITRYVDRDNPILLIGGIAVVGGIILLLNYRYRQLKKRHQRALAESLHEGTVSS